MTNNTHSRLPRVKSRNTEDNYKYDHLSYFIHFVHLLIFFFKFILLFTICDRERISDCLAYHVNVFLFKMIQLQVTTELKSVFGRPKILDMNAYSSISSSHLLNFFYKQASNHDCLSGTSTFVSLVVGLYRFISEAVKSFLFLFLIFSIFY